MSYLPQVCELIERARAEAEAAACGSEAGARVRLIDEVLPRLRRAESLLQDANKEPTLVTSEAQVKRLPLLGNV